MFLYSTLGFQEKKKIIYVAKFQHLKYKNISIQNLSYELK